MNQIEVLRECRTRLESTEHECFALCGKLDALIADYERAEPAAAHYFNVYGDRVEAPPQSHKGNTMSNEREPLTDYDIDLLCQAEMGAPAGNFDLAFARVIEREVLARASAAPQEPVAWMTQDGESFWSGPDSITEPGWIALYADPQPQAAPQEPAGWLFEDALPKEYPYDAMFQFSQVRDGVRMFPVYAAPQPQASPQEPEPDPSDELAWYKWATKKKEAP